MLIASNFAILSLDSFSFFVNELSSSGAIANTFNAILLPIPLPLIWESAASLDANLGAQWASSMNAKIFSNEIVWDTLFFILLADSLSTNSAVCASNTLG